MLSFDCSIKYPFTYLAFNHTCNSIDNPDYPPHCARIFYFIRTHLLILKNIGAPVLFLSAEKSASRRIRLPRIHCVTFVRLNAFDQTYKRLRQLFFSVSNGHGRFLHTCYHKLYYLTLREKNDSFIHTNNVFTLHTWYLYIRISLYVPKNHSKQAYAVSLTLSA